MFFMFLDRKTRTSVVLDTDTNTDRVNPMLD
jgi:hypothetical protein